MVESTSMARFVLWIFAAVVLGYYTLTPGVFGSKAQGDGWYGFHYLPAMVLHQTLDMSPVSPKDRAHFDRNQRGVEINRNPIGASLAMLPAYSLTLLTEGVVRVVYPKQRELASESPFGINELQLFWCGLVSCVAGLFAMRLLFRLLFRYTGRAGPALLGTFAAVFATPLFWYLTTQPHYQHGLTFAAVVLLIERWDAARIRYPDWADDVHFGAPFVQTFFALGILAGVAMTIRPQEVVFVLLPGLHAASWFVRGVIRKELRVVQRSVVVALVLAVGVALGFLPQLLMWAYYFGAFARPTTVELMRYGEPALWEVLFSMRAGLFPWTPLCYLAIPGLLFGIFWKANRDRLSLVLLLLVVLGCDIYLVAASWVWYGAFGFGCRRLADCAPIFALGIALLGAASLAQKRPLLRRSLAGGLVFCVVALSCLNLLLLDLQRRRVLPSSGSAARPASVWVSMAKGPRWLSQWLEGGYPFVQPMGALFALRHSAARTSWEAVVGNYALEREAHDLSEVFGGLWDFRDKNTAAHVVEGLLPVDASTPEKGRRIAAKMRMLLQPFASEPITGILSGQIPPGKLQLSWDEKPIPWTRIGRQIHFTIEVQRVRAHRVGELTLILPTEHEHDPEAKDPPPRLLSLRLISSTKWWLPP